jgi:hypothetical protein
MPVFPATVTFSQDFSEIMYLPILNTYFLLETRLEANKSNVSTASFVHFHYTLTHAMMKTSDGISSTLERTIHLVPMA